MTSFLHLVHIRLRNQLLYKFDIVSSLLGTGLQLVSILWYWRYLLTTNQANTIYTGTTIYWYYGIVFFVELLLNYEIAFSVEEDITTGKLSHFLLLPCSYITIKLAEYISSNLFFILLFFLSFILCQLLGILTFSFSFILLVFEGILFYFLFSMTIGFLTIWLKRVDNLLYFIETLSSLIAGTIIPISQFPSWIQYNPFALSIGAVADSLIGTSNNPYSFLYLAGWCFIQFLILLFVKQKALKSYEAFGG